MSDKISKHYGEGGRLKKAADTLLVQTAYLHDCEDGGILMPYLATANYAHLLILQKAKLIPLEEGKKLSKALLELESYDVDKFDLDPANGDIYNNFDVFLRDKAGESAGWLHAGRPRREAVNVAFLLALREAYLETIKVSNDLLQVFVEKSRANLDTIMPDFTYLHHAQPTSFGHYVLTFAEGLKRDLDRIKSAYARVNSSPGESGSVNGSRLNIDKKYFAKLLGFENVSVHSRDAMWQPDIPLEVIASLGSLMMNLTRLAEELQIWNSKEFNFVILPDSLCRASVIMPQKKNPYPLTYFRGLCNNIISKFSGYGAYGRVFSGNPDSRIFIYGDLITHILKVNKAIELLAKVLNEMELNKPKMLTSIKNSDAYATDIADELIGSGKINYREAHQIVGKIARELNEEGKNINNLDVSKLNRVIEEVSGHSGLISEKKMKGLLDPVEVVASRKTTGGANSKEVLKMCKVLERQNKLNNKFISNKLQFMQKANQYFKSEVSKNYE